MLDNINFLLIREIVSSVLIIIGVVFMTISTIGLLRFPDFYIRMSAITKGATLGLGLILTGMGIYFNEPDMFLKVMLIIGFTFLTSPVAAHVIGRTAVRNKIPFWERTNLEEFKDYLHKEHSAHRDHERDNKQV
ncbi:monovalent cation/H(+) antiporter subunit G [Pontibacter ramchanderi]|uniref:Multisubunit sodium/proton antiporter MrpG subunit n=1 Tax=Pontibacter ramchanderi TaxID=1179743 RepID=A0A2N3V1W6_9BACT|nr:monovalent cation/H(+) antiporter subunit G [Pontibacter ramchanderi]PKV75612.1 multisubunit sodium/proton antiporter MrpG subunit [Pontibacter ramchanderi]